MPEMQQQMQTYLVRFSVISGVIFLIAGAGVTFYYSGGLVAFVAAYVLSYLFTGSNFFLMRFLSIHNQTRFSYVFGLSVAFRFLLVIGTVTVLLETLNNHQFFFTVSFIISYICHSINEIIFFNKILQTDI